MIKKVPWLDFVWELSSVNMMTQYNSKVSYHLLSCISSLAKRESWLMRKGSHLSRRDSRLARTTEAYILEEITSN